MSVYDANDFAGHEQVSFFCDEETGLKAIIAIHNLNRGPALGGCRMYPYATEAEALRDVLRLSRGMTYKAASMNVELGGGKSVIIGDAHTQKTPELLHARTSAPTRTTWPRSRPRQSTSRVCTRRTAATATRRR